MNNLYLFNFKESHSMLLVVAKDVKTTPWQGHPLEEPEFSHAAGLIEKGFFWGKELKPFQMEFVVLEKDGETYTMDWHRQPTLLSSLFVAILDGKADCYVFKADEFERFKNFIIKQETFNEPGMEYALKNGHLRDVAEEVFGVELGD